MTRREIFTIISFLVAIINAKYIPTRIPITNRTSNGFRYVSHPVPSVVQSTPKSILRIAAHSPDYFHYHYMQNLRRQHEKLPEESIVSALRGPTKHQILGKPSSDVELSILEDLQRQTKNFTLDDAKPVMETAASTKKKNVTTRKPRHPSREKKKNEVQVQERYKEVVEETKPGLDKNGKRRTIKTKKTMSYATTIKPITMSSNRKKSSHYSRTRSSAYDSDDHDMDHDDSYETSDTKKVFTTLKQRKKNLNPHLYEAPNDHFMPDNEDPDNYSMDWDDSWNVKDFVVRRNGMEYTPGMEKRRQQVGAPRRHAKRKSKPKKKAKRESGEIPMLEVYGGGTFADYGNDEYYDTNDYDNGDYDYYPNGDEIVNKRYQDIYTKHSFPYVYEYGHLFENPYGWEERFQDANYLQNRHKGKVIWVNNDGDYGQHYWDLNP